MSRSSNPDIVFAQEERYGEESEGARGKFMQKMRALGVSDGTVEALAAEVARETFPFPEAREGVSTDTIEGISRNQSRLVQVLLEDYAKTDDVDKVIWRGRENSRKRND